MSRVDTAGGLTPTEGADAAGPAHAAARYGGAVRCLASLLLAALALASCGGAEEPQGATVSGFAVVGGDVRPGGAIAARFTCDGEDVSPELRWRPAWGALTQEAGIPAEQAVVLEDPDAPGGTFTHWLVYGLAADVADLPEGLPADARSTRGGTALRQGRNDFGAVGYRGPCPPRGETHRYVFHVLALDTKLDLEPAADRKAFDAAVKGHVLAEARLEAPYTRAG